MLLKGGIGRIYKILLQEALLIVINQSQVIYMISIRTRSSLCLYMTLFNPVVVRILFDKHGIPKEYLLEQGMEFTPYVTEALRSTVLSAPSEQLLDLIRECVRTKTDLRGKSTSAYAHNERWHDLAQCLQLDGYQIVDQNLISTEPSIQGFEPLEDDLTVELRSSGLIEADGVLRLLDQSAEDFRKMTPDYNGCLTNARVALETLARLIANARKRTHHGSFDENKWGEVLAYLRKSGLIKEREEEGISGVYGFVSEGAHRLVALSDQEMARLGRSLVLAMCYFLVKLYVSRFS
jgi:hypothetical protein